jgi:hypothetical protein
MCATAMAGFRLLVGLSVLIFAICYPEITQKYLNQFVRRAALLLCFQDLERSFTAPV